MKLRAYILVANAVLDLTETLCFRFFYSYIAQYFFELLEIECSNNIIDGNNKGLNLEDVPYLL